MSFAYVFNTRKGRIIITDERSTIGYCYPRLFIEDKDANEYTNVDLTIGDAFRQKQHEFESWLDGTEVTDANFSEVTKKYNLSTIGLIRVIAEVYGDTTEQEMLEDLKVNQLEINNATDKYMVDYLTNYAVTHSTTVEQLLEKYSNQRLDEGDYKGMQSGLDYTWYNLQLLNKTNLRILNYYDNHYIYDTTIYTLESFHLTPRYKQGNPTTIIGLTDARKLFNEITFPNEVTFKSMDISSISRYDGMFTQCVFPNNFVFDLDISKVEDIFNLFDHCKFGNNFTFKDSNLFTNASDLARFVSKMKYNYNKFDYTPFIENSLKCLDVDTEFIRMYEFSISDTICKEHNIDLDDSRERAILGFTILQE